MNHRPRPSDSDAARVRITLGTATLSPSAAGELRVGDVIELDESPDAPVRVQASGQLVGEGQAVSVSDPDGKPRLAVAMHAAKTTVRTTTLAILTAVLLSLAVPADVAAQATQPTVAMTDRSTVDDFENRPLGGNRGGGGDKPSTDPAGFGWVEMLQTLAALAVVVGVIFVTRWALRRLNRRLMAAAGSSSALRVLATTPLAGRGDLVLVKLGGRLVLVGATSQGMTSLSEITDAAEVAAVEESIERHGTESIRKMFRRPERFKPGRQESNHSA
jgi:flagellar biogenesis protein FliO